MKFYKYQGAGNDFLIADNRDGRIREVDGVLTADCADGTVWTAEISELCDRRYGVGADGLMLLENGGQDLDFRMVYFNSDGSGGMMCGNGGRCIVAFAADMGVEASGEDGTYVFEAADGLHTAQVIMDEGKVKTVRIKMKDVSEAVHHESLGGVDCLSEGWFLDTGTRHFVRMVCGLEDYDVVNEGRTIRYGAEELKPIGANVNFIEPEDGILKVRTYEKGVEDETFACGTGIVASAIAAYLNGLPSTSSAGDLLTYDIRAKRDALRVEFRPVASGGFLAVDVYLTGPATYVAEISF
jgi:diaminopimelate epimerase